MDKIIFTAILIVFPLGQLLKWQFINLFDVLVVILAFWTIIQKPKHPKWFPYFLTFVVFGLFSLVVNYKLTEIRSILYLVRIFAYSFVGVYIFNQVKKTYVLNYLLYVSIVSAIAGWLQYVFLPDTVFLRSLGWDDHLYRMIGTFLDPAFLALVLLLGIIIAEYKNFNKVFYFLLFSLALTYSRATYLVLGLLLVYKKRYLAILIFVLTIFLLPKMTSEGTNFARTASGYQKLVNYKETIQIISKSPVIGVGFNNICFVKENTNIRSHSCFGADNSVLFILATTGIVGLILFLSFVLKISNSIHTTNYTLLSTSFVAVLIHGLFTNSLFYPHVMFWLFCLLGLGVKDDLKRS